ncbi:MAG: carboxypeptidase regulatory-like domain-containing protein [Bacteroidales bacterium]|nr:carboxypeptidase regulatory-like domain-containing protein [Bacteroidales bacterium]
MKNIYKLFLLLTAAVVFNISAMAQVTTSGINGRVTNMNNEPLPGATVIITHEASGSMYGTVTDPDGFFRILNMRVGGPYKVTISFIGYKNQVIENIYLNLGQTYGLNGTLVEEVSQIPGVEVVGTRNDLFDGNRMGSVSYYTSEQISSLPSISRSIDDYVKYSPQVNGRSIAGQDGRYNNITVDGANFNNNFGLSSKALPGGDAQPISLDAIEEVSVNVAPYDITQSNFTGGNVNAVTKSGNNKLEGSVYTFYRNKKFNGKYVGEDRKDTLKLTDNSFYNVGARLGGPIIKDKLFFFVNGEWEKSIFPGILWSPSDPENGIEADATKYISRTTVNDMETISNFLKNNYNYDPGPYQGFGDFASQNYKLLARVDWNLHKDHKLTVRYNYVHSTNDQEVNATSAPRPRSTDGRISAKSMAFENANYNFLNTVGSLTGELNSVFGKNLANKFLFTYTKIRDTRGSNSDIFPFVDIWKDKTAYMSFGYELFTFENDVKNNIWTITDNISYFLGIHTITGGISFEHMYFGNSYKRYGTSYYRYASMEDFMNDAAPIAYGLTYPYEGAGSGYAELNFGWGSIYAQDEIQVSDNFKASIGLRLEMPFYFDDPFANEAIEALTFKDLDGNDETLDVGSWPDSKLSVSPRVGFNWDALGNRTLQIRGGTGLFTGRLPFVWFTNQPTNSGTLQNTVEKTDSTFLSKIHFNTDPMAYEGEFPSEGGTTAPGNLAVVDKDFKMPQVWRSSLAADYKLPFWGLEFTIEGMYTKDITAIIQRNANQAIPNGTFKGPDDRPRFIGKNSHLVNENIQSAMVLDNADALDYDEQGHAYSLTLILNKPFTKGFFGSFSYTYSIAKDITANPGSAANSAWQSNPAVIHQNDPGISFSQFAVPHKIVGTLSYNVEYANHLGTTFSLTYVGRHQGRLDYIYYNDMNGDGNAADLMYIPKDESEIIFTPIQDKEGNEIYSAEQQNEAFWKYVEQDDYLKEHKGEYAERYGVLMPWLGRLDLRVLQDIFADFGKDRRHTLQLSLDFLNIGNLLNSDWGCYKTQVLGTYDITLLRYINVNEDGVPTFQLNQVNNQLPTETYTNVLSTSSTWGAQIGLRYTF